MAILPHTEKDGVEPPAFVGQCMRRDSRRTVHRDLGRGGGPELARSHGQTLSLAINALTNPDLGALGALLGLRTIAFIDPIELRASGTHISGQVDVSRAQLERLMSLAEELLAEWNGSRETRPNLAHPSSPR